MDAFKEYSNEYEFTAEGVFVFANLVLTPRANPNLTPTSDS
jgi:hypothetical protein